MIVQLGRLRIYFEDDKVLKKTSDRIYGKAMVREVRFQQVLVNCILLSCWK